MISMRRLLFALLLATPSFVLAGCPGSLEDPGRFDAQFGIGGGGGSAPCDVPMLFQTSCALAGCHTGAMPANNLDLSVTDVASELSGKMAFGGTGLLIDPTNPSDSVLYTKVTDAFPFGGRMPLNNTPLDDATQACLLDWITMSTKGSP